VLRNYLRRALPVATLVSLLVLGYAGNAAAQAINPPTKFTTPYCTDSSFPAACTKTITIYNNYDHPIYPVIQGTLEQGPGQNSTTCPKGDRWLQAAFGDPNNCYAIAYNYLIYVNGIAGIPMHEHATINLPWWSKRAQIPNDPNPDIYIDWWNGARIFIFDDQNAVNDSYMIDNTRPVKFEPTSPIPACDAADPGSVCKSKLTIAYQTCAAAPDGSNPCIPGTNAIKAETPQQLNEYTLASVDPVEGLTNWNVNYNVSNVDQVYLPIAIEPMVHADRSRNNAMNTTGYLGTTLKVGVLRERLMDFTGATGSPDDPQNPTMWPIYTVQKDKTGALLYPMAGIRVPGAANVFNFLAQPSGNGLTPSPKCAAPGCIPTTSNGPWSGTKLVDGMIAQWMTCTLSPTSACRAEEVPFYADVNQAFRTNYKQYFDQCGASFPPWLAPVGSTNLPNLYAFLQFVYGWVPFNVACGGIDLPTGMIPREYIRLEDNFQEQRGVPPAMGQAIFNPYAQLIHASPRGTVVPLSPPVPFGLDAAAYAYSIDDQSSFLSEAGVGLIFAVGGETGLPNPAKHIFPPPLDPEHDIQVVLGPPRAPNLDRPAWQSYAICPANPNAAPTISFPNPSTDPDGGQRFNVPTNDRKIWREPCYLTISDFANKVYQIKITKTLPWPPFNNVANNGSFDHNVMTCPTPHVPGYTNVEGNPNDKNNWCGAANEVSNPVGTPTNAQRFELDMRPPNP
jgi:hypothetical protein